MARVIRWIIIASSSSSSGIPRSSSMCGIGFPRCARQRLYIMVSEIVVALGSSWFRSGFKGGDIDGFVIRGIRVHCRCCNSLCDFFSLLKPNWTFSSVSIVMWLMMKGIPPICPPSTLYCFHTCHLWHRCSQRNWMCCLALWKLLYWGDTWRIQIHIS